MFAIGRETNNVYDGLIWRKTRIVNRVEDKRRFTLENPATREKKKKETRLDCLSAFSIPLDAFYTRCNSASMRCNLKTTRWRKVQTQRKELNSR